ncbi:hypothetical protein JW933_10455, partial [candidate division FCPU426 bacterium]|nr:hypothetical protein [candidate division FCPU426 bacterium]
MVQQALKILQLPTIELANMVNQELAENPMLEEAGDNEAPSPEPVPEGQESIASKDHTEEVVMAEDGSSPPDMAEESWDAYFRDDEYEIPKYDRETIAEFREP